MNTTAINIHGVHRVVIEKTLRTRANGESYHVCFLTLVGDNCESTDIACFSKSEIVIEHK